MNSPFNPAPTGVTARYQGPGSSASTTTFYYWVQALYSSGWSQLSTPANTGAYCPAGLSSGSFVSVQWNFAPGAIGFLVWRGTTSTAPGYGATAIFIATAETGFKDDGNSPTFVQTPRYDGIYTARAIWDFATDGGLSTSVYTTPAVSDIIPAGAMVIGGYALGAITIVGPTAIDIGTQAGSTNPSLLSAAAIAGLAAGDLLPLLPTATPADAFVMTTAGAIAIKFTVAVATAGRTEIIVFYIVPTT